MTHLKVKAQPCSVVNDHPYAGASVPPDPGSRVFILIENVHVFLYHKSKLYCSTKLTVQYSNSTVSICTCNVCWFLC